MNTEMLLKFAAALVPCSTIGLFPVFGFVSAAPGVFDLLVALNILDCHRTRVLDVLKLTG